MIKVCLDYQEITLVFSVAGEGLHKLPGQVLKHFFLELFFVKRLFCPEFVFHLENIWNFCPLTLVLPLPRLILMLDREKQGL